MRAPLPGSSKPDYRKTTKAATLWTLTRCPFCRQDQLHVVAIFRPWQIPAPALDTS